MFKQISYRNGEMLERTFERTDAEMVGILAQMMFERQAGCEVELKPVVDKRYNILEYQLTRKIDSERTMMYRFIKE